MQKLRGIVPIECFESLEKIQGASTNAKSPTLASPDSSRVSYVRIPNMEQKADAQWYFTLEVEFADQSKSILFRTFDDFWILHISLLTHFPVESGRTGQGRVIPFLPQPQKNMNQEAAASKRAAAEAYLERFLELPSSLLNHSSTKRFFNTRAGDLNTMLNIKFDASSTLLDLLADFENQSEMTLSIKMGDETLNWVESEDITYKQLIEKVEDELGFRFRALLYKDECGSMIPLKGDRDLSLLISTNRSNLVFFVS